MVGGIGVDIVQIGRFKEWSDDEKKLSRYFHPSEVAYCLSQNDSAASFAARFAAREAFVKAVGSGFQDLARDDIWVDRDELGKPFFRMKAKAQKALERVSASRVHLTLSHERDYAIAFVVIE